jgi:hypothetical protein
LPWLARGCNDDIADSVRSNWEIEIDTDVPADELELALLVGVPPPEDEELLLQAAAARHRASDADAATAPFLTIEFINHLAS